MVNPRPSFSASQADLEPGEISVLVFGVITKGIEYSGHAKKVGHVEIRVCQRGFARSWFQHSSLLGMLQTLSRQKNVTIVITTDHGSVRCMRGSKVIGDREASTSLRYKYGRNLKIDNKNAIFVKNPADFRLPSHSVTTNFIMAKEDYFFVYPTDYHRYLQQYRDSFQHGGISMEEMILPVVTLRSK